MIFDQSEELAEERRLPLSRRLTLMINHIADALPEKVAKAQLGDATRALNLLVDLRETLAERESEKKLERLDDWYARLLDEEAEKKRKADAR